MCNGNCSSCKTALDRELKTGDLIRVVSYREPQVFLFGYGNFVYHIAKWEYDRGYIAGNISSVDKSKVSPARKILKVKKASEIVKWLEDNGYQVDKYGDWHKGGSFCFVAAMFTCCGNEPDKSRFAWREEWLEEVYEPTA